MPRRGAGPASARGAGPGAQHALRRGCGGVYCGRGRMGDLCAVGVCGGAGLLAGDRVPPVLLRHLQPPPAPLTLTPPAPLTLTPPASLTPAPALAHPEGVGVGLVGAPRERLEPLPEGLQVRLERPLTAHPPHPTPPRLSKGAGPNRAESKDARRSAEADMSPLSASPLSAPPSGQREMMPSACSGRSLAAGRGREGGGREGGREKERGRKRAREKERKIGRERGRE